jgi:hypothetical protein
MPLSTKPADELTPLTPPVGEDETKLVPLPVPEEDITKLVPLTPPAGEEQYTVTE